MTRRPPRQSSSKGPELRFIVTVLIIALSGIVLGGASAYYSIRQSHRIGAVNIGPWTAVVHESGEEVDPYVIARSVVEGTVPLGATEGLAFEAMTDSSGEPLLRECDYRIEGSAPPARLWTLVAYGSGGRQVEPAPGGQSAVQSNRLLRFGDGTFLITAASAARSGNWMALSGSGPMRLVMRLYDTPITASAGLAPPAMPAIVREDCRR